MGLVYIISVFIYQWFDNKPSQHFIPGESDIKSIMDLVVCLNNNNDGNIKL